MLAGPDSIAGLLSREVNSLRSFVELLHREEQLLSVGNSEGLAELAAEKSSYAVELSRLSNARDEALAQIRFPAGRAGMDAWTLTDAGAESQGMWNQLLELAAEARSINSANGKAIAMLLQHNQQALAILMAAANQTATYGPDGQPCPGGSGRSLGSA